MGNVDVNNILDKMKKDCNSNNLEPEIIVTGSPVINGMFNGGIPRQSLIHIAAESGAGKSTLALEMSRELCKKGENVLYIDAEGGLNKSMLETMCLLPYYENTDTSIGGMFYKSNDYDCNKINTLLHKVDDDKFFKFVVLDSLGALDDGAYDIGGSDVNNPKVGGTAKAIRTIMKTMNGIKNDSQITFICINHMAKTIGTFIPVNKPMGGTAPVYFSDISIELTTKSSEFEKQNLGQKVEYKAQKSRRGPGKIKVPFYIRYGRGIAMVPTYREIMEDIDITFNGEPHKLLEFRGGGNGSLYIKDEEFKFRGENQLMKLIKENCIYISSIIPDSVFTIQPITSDIYDVDSSSDKTIDLPKDLSSEQYTVKDTRAVFQEGVDATGQVYSLFYDSGMDSLGLEYNGSEEYDKATKVKYNLLKKKLSNYLDSCNEEMKA